MTDIFGIGVSGLKAYQYALSITSQNIANSNTPNYSRKEVDLVTGAFGTGVNIADVRRIYSDAANQSLLLANNSYAFANISSTSYASLEPMLDDNKINITKYLTDVNNSIQQLTANPSSIQLRTDYLSRLNALKTQFNTTAGFLQQQQQSVNLNISTDVTAVNQILNQLAAVNRNITGLTADDQLDLSDNRDQLLQQLAQYMNFTTTTDQFNSLTVQLSNGSPILQGGTAFQLVTSPNAQNSALMQITMQNGNVSYPITSLITNGEIAGLLDYQNNGIQTAMHGLSRLALAVADQFNQQNKLGMDLNGNLGTNIFTDINQTNSVVNRVMSNANNKSVASMQVNIDDVTQLTISDYSFNVDSANHYSLTRITDGTLMGSGNIGTLPQSLSVDGFTVTIAGGSFSVGDNYTISPTNNGANTLAMNIGLPQQLALALPIDAVANAQNQGSGVINVAEVTDTTNSSFATPHQLDPPIQIQFLSSTSYQLVNANTSAVMEGPLTYDPINGSTVFPTPGGYDPGYRININGAVSAGDSFNINYNADGSGDNRNAQNLANIFQNPLLQNGTVTLTQAYNLMSSDISVKTNSANIAADSSQVLLDQSQSSRDQISAVSLEEESANLARFQQAYQANAQVMQAAKSIFETILSVARGG